MLMKRREKVVGGEADERLYGRRSPFSIATGRGTMRIGQTAKILKLLQVQLGSYRRGDQMDRKGPGKFAVNLSPRAAEG